MDRLKGKVILISGGARGQGAAEARLFVAEGARVVLGDVLESEGNQLAAELGKAAVFVRQDLTKEADEVASLVLFLLSNESAYITGAEVAIDGGATL
jgi:3alpha(or 20beta)-hydroxysteroid dehydrogenase